MTESPVTDPSEPGGGQEQVAGATQDTETSEAARGSLSEASETTGDDGSADEGGSDSEDPDRPGAGSAEGGSAEGGSTRRESAESPIEAEGELVADYLEELLDIADLDGDIDTYVESDRAHVSIVTEGDQLVGRDGEVLDALQELSRLVVMTETGRRSRLMLDVGGYRDRRRSVLVGLAGEAVAEVRSSGASVRLSPMNPFERKIVHDTVADAGLTSESEGEEPSRRVVVLPAAG